MQAWTKHANMHIMVDRCPAQSLLLLM